MSLDIGGLFGNYSYTIICFVSALCLFIIANRIVSTKYKQNIDKDFVVLIALAMLFCLQDGVWGALKIDGVYIKTPGILHIWTYIFYLATALSGFVWTNYVIEYTDQNYKRRDIILIIRLFVLIPQVVLIMINPWTHLVFTCSNDNASFKTEEFGFIIYLLQAVLFLFGLIIALISLAQSKSKNERVRNFAAVLFSLLPFVGGILFALDDTVPFISGAVMFSVLVMFVYNLNDLKEEALAQKFDEQIKLKNESLEIVRTLSTDYLSVYYVDFETEDMTVYRVSPEVEAIFGDMLYKRVNFSKVLMYYLDHAIMNSDKEELLPFASASFLKSLVKETPTYTRIYRVGTEEHFKYTQMRLVKSSEDADGNALSIILGIQDIDDVIHKEKDLQTELENAKKDADKASTAKTTFLFNMSHDIRTPMNAIMGFTDMAKKHIDEKEKVSECLTKVKTSSEHLLSLINDVLDMSRIESGKVNLEESVCNISDEMNSMISMLNVNAKNKNITINYEEKNLTHKTIIFDPLHVQRVLINIVGNSIKYTSEGGKIDIIVEESPVAENGLLPFTFVVSDNGMGMAKEYVEHIFEPFTREKTSTVSKIQGTGLGMAITKNLMDLLGGEIKVESEKGVGTTTTMKFWFKDAQGQVAKEGSEEEEVISLVGKKVLLVEDNELNREIAKDILSEEGLIIEEAVDGLAAVHQVTTHPVDYYDFILMDIQMPNMDGYEATKHIRAYDQEKYKDVPIIAMTANAFEEDKKHAIDIGMNAHVAKPINIPKLLKVLQSFVKK